MQSISTRTLHLSSLVISVLTLFIMLTVTVSAESMSGSIEVKGSIPSYKPPVGSIVTVKCGTQSNTAATDDKGKFSTAFNKTADCTKDTIVTGTFENYYGTSKVSNSYKVDALQLRKTEAVPEIGTIASFAAVAVAGGAIVYARRRTAQNTIA